MVQLLVLMQNPPPTFLLRSLTELEIEDEASCRHVGLYAELRRVLIGASYRFRVLPEESRGRWDRALLLNLTFWSAQEGGDVLVDESIDADVVAHVAWHHLAQKQLVAAGAVPTADAMFLAEAIASAFDVYLVGRLLGHAPRSSFLASQVPAMSDACAGAGLSEEEFDALLQGIVKDPDAAFESLRQLLFDTARALLEAPDASAALLVLAQADTHPLAPLLHRFELSNWVLYARAYAPKGLAPDPLVREVDAALRAAPVSLDWLEKRWLAP